MPENSFARYLNASPYVEGRRMNLPVKNVNEAAGFYTTIMKFKEVSRTDSPVPTITFERDNIQMAIAENGGDPSQEGCFFEVDNVEAAFAEFKQNGLTSYSPIKTQKNGDTNWKQFFVIAPDGLCFCIGEKA